jgi:hypothetical protein
VSDARGKARRSVHAACWCACHHIIASVCVRVDATASVCGIRRLQRHAVPFLFADAQACRPRLKLLVLPPRAAAGSSAASTEGCLWQCERQKASHKLANATTMTAQQPLQRRPLQAHRTCRPCTARWCGCTPSRACSRCRQGCDRRARHSCRMPPAHAPPAQGTTAGGAASCPPRRSARGEGAAQSHDASHASSALGCLGRRVACVRGFALPFGGLLRPAGSGAAPCVPSAHAPQR